LWNPQATANFEAIRAASFQAWRERGIVRVLHQNNRIEEFRIVCLVMTRLLFIGLVAFASYGLYASTTSAQASDVYITPDGGGSGACTNNVHPLSWFNNSANWGSGGTQIGPGTLVHLCGTFSSGLTAQGSGSSGNPVTIKWEAGAKLSAPAYAGVWFILDNQHDIILDGGGPGGTNGIIENTANGSSLGNRVQSDAIRADSGANIEVKNLLIRNIYVHNSVSDTTTDGASSNCFLENHPKGFISIHDNVMHDENWCLKIGQMTNAGVTVSIYNNEIYNIDHGLALYGDTTDQLYTLIFHDNWIHDFANWDTTVNEYHHDGIHMFTGTGNRTFYNNKFSGSMGHNNTSYVFEEIMQGGNKGSDPGGSQLWYNNVWIQSPNNLISNALAFITGNAVFYNNTFICADSNGGDNQEGIRYNFGTGYYNTTTRHLTFENNVMSGCVTFFEGVNTTVDALNNNVYTAATSGGQHKWSLNGTPSDTLAQWQLSSGKDSAASYSSTSGLDGSGVPQPGSAAIGKALPLTNLGIASLNFDTSAGNTKTPILRGAQWTVGAFADSSAVTAGPPAPPTGLNATVQ
jgi:hypothetical protein